MVRDHVEPSSASKSSKLSSSIDRITFAFGIGLVGVYDFGTMSSQTMVDNAVILFSIFFTTLAFARSVIVRVLYLAMTTCIKTDVGINIHYLLFVILPLSSEFLHAQKIFTIYIYVNLMFSLIAYLALLTLTISRLLHNEFRSVKNEYMVGILCFFCCNLSYPLAMSVISKNKITGLLQGMNLIVLYLGGFKVAVVMWIYGVGKFSTDIQFSLGFKPTQFWTTCWMVHPILTLVFIIHKFYILFNLTEKVQMILASTWILFSFCFVTIFQIKTIAKYIVRNNLVGVLRASPQYGPPEPEDRRKRQAFNVELLQRQCRHRCIVNDLKRQMWVSLKVYAKLSMYLVSPTWLREPLTLF
ncbi:sodium-dependent nutrient amino acid transporter 1-like [Battus philenor]|uniref:sodium-dependent nutrient amino acid transporter 1-like n=1 Tax=Battus philenor TaxID=42288 RepID=UPI0035D115E4